MLAGSHRASRVRVTVLRGVLVGFGPRGVFVGVGVGVSVAVGGADVGLAVTAAVGVRVAVGVLVAVAVGRDCVGVAVGVAVGVVAGTCVAVGVGAGGLYPSVMTSKSLATSPANAGFSVSLFQRVS